MTTKDKQIELKDKILIGLEKVYERLIEFKKEKNSKLVIIRGDKIVKIKPE
jgi:biopolymer transport protein ExbD